VDVIDQVIPAPARQQRRVEMKTALIIRHLRRSKRNAGRTCENYMRVELAGG
jgi:hypothetical protein